MRKINKELKLFLEKRSHRLMRRRMKQIRKLERNREKRRKWEQSHKEELRRLSVALRAYLGVDQVLAKRKKHFNTAIKLPRIFSLIENPDESMKIMHELAGKIRMNPSGLFFDYTNCEVLGLCASAVMDVIVLNQMKYASRRKLSFPRLSGNYPKSDDAQKIFLATGLIKHLGITNNVDPNDMFRESVTLLELQGREGRRRTTPRASSQEEIASTQFVEYLERCFKRQHLDLGLQEQNYLSKLCGEVLDNATEHSGRSNWYIIGYSQSIIDNSESIEECNIVILDFGLTIAEAMKMMETTNPAKSQIEELVENHSKKNLFQKCRYTPENLYTLFALHQGISSAQNAIKKVRGQGTIEMIRAFERLSQQTSNAKKPLMVLISGSTMIRFDGKYSLQETRTNAGKEVLAMTFNREGDPYLPPDPHSVIALDSSLPGTLLSVRIYLSGEKR